MNDKNFKKEYRVLVTTLNVRGTSFHIGDVADEEQLGRMAGLLEKCGYIHQVTEAKMQTAPMRQAA